MPVGTLIESRWVAPSTVLIAARLSTATVTERTVRIKPSYRRGIDRQLAVCHQRATNAPPTRHYAVATARRSPATALSKLSSFLEFGEVPSDFAIFGMLDDDAEGF